MENEDACKEISKEQEALNTLYAVALAFVKFTHYIDESSATAYLKTKKDLIQELVDKETPKKPIGEKYNEICPICNEDSVRSEFASNYELKRCHECGQLLDWGKDEKGATQC